MFGDSEEITCTIRDFGWRYLDSGIHLSAIYVVLLCSFTLAVFQVSDFVLNHSISCCVRCTVHSPVKSVLIPTCRVKLSERNIVIRQKTKR